MLIMVIPSDEIGMAKSSTQGVPTVPLALYEELLARFEELKTAYSILQARDGESNAKCSTLSAENDRMAARAATMERVLIRLAGRAGMVLPRGDGPKEPHSGDFHALVSGIESGLDAFAAAQNGRSVRGDGHDKVWGRMIDMDGFIQDDGALHDFTGLEPIQFEYVVHRVEEYMETHPVRLYYDTDSRKSDPGNRSKLKTRYAVFMVMFQKRTNLRPNIVGRIFGVHRTTVKRQALTVDTALENVLPTAPAMAERLRMIKDTEEFVKFTGGAFMQDGTLTPALDSRDADNPETSGFSGKHHQAGFSTLVMAAKTEVIFDVTKSAPGNQHDITICRNNPVDFGLWSTASIPDCLGAAVTMRIIILLLDKGFIGYGKYFPWVRTWIPHRGKNKKSPKELAEAYASKDMEAIAAAHGLTLEQYRENLEQSSERSLIERIIGRMKMWRVLAGIFYGTASQLHQQFIIVSGFLNMSVLWHEVERDECQLLAALREKRARYRKRR